MTYKILTLLLIVVTPLFVFANRVSEVEDYYVERTSKFIQSRFPQQAFTVYAAVEIEKNEVNKSKSESLPYFDVVDKENDIWSKKDIPLSTLISYVDKVSIKVDLETEMDATELNLLHNQLFEHLKLSTASDKIEIVKIKPKLPTNQKQVPYGWWFWALLFSGVLITLLISIQWGVKSLVKGLSSPLAELGKINQNVSTQGFSSRDQSRDTFEVSSNRNGDSSYDSRRLFKELFEENKNLFERPTVELMNFLEEHGAQQPLALTAVFAELNKEKLKELFSYGTGDWWYTTLSTAPQITGESFNILLKLHKLKIKNQLGAGNSPLVDSEIMDFAIIFNRLTEPMLESLLKPYSFQTAAPLLQLLPQSKSMKICKSLFPGNWSQFISDSLSKNSVSSQEIKKIQKKALELMPLRSTQSLEDFFKQLEFEKYLDHANTWDEKEFYKALPPQSPIKIHRTPFYALFDLDVEAFKKVLQEISIDEIALVLPDCERPESSRVFEQLTERQRFRLKELLNQKKTDEKTLERRIFTKRKVSELIKRMQQQTPPVQEETQKAA